MHALVLFIAGMLLWGVCASISIFFSLLMVPQRKLIYLIHRYPRQSTKLTVSIIVAIFFAEIFGAETSVEFVYAGTLGTAMSVASDILETMRG
ncbi:MAG: hypothetical protein GY737_17340 [Desulfobacteraceae bacterium]|nr:hypothetical protein [Desulfobacteraceae bacterium]